MIWLQLPDTERMKILNAIGGATQLSTAAIEKDWWVTVVLDACFRTPWAGQLAFKGGTSLSKAWGLIERFSEDIDLVLDRAALGFQSDLTSSQIRKLRERSAAFVANTFLPALQQVLLDMGVPAASFNLSIQAGGTADRDPQILELRYHSVYDPDPYLVDKVLLEIGVRSMMEPSSPRAIQSIIDQTLTAQAYAGAAFTIRTIDPTRTFLEKLFLLHEEWTKPTEKIRRSRMSRHLYDLHCLMDTPAGQTALADTALYHRIVDHRARYNAQRGLNYASHAPATLQFVPPAALHAALEADYGLMRNTMIYGDAPSFPELLARLESLLKRVREIPQ
jgi:hypothetical protein